MNRWKGKSSIKEDISTYIARCTLSSKWHLQADVTSSGPDARGDVHRHTSSFEENPMRHPTSTSQDNTLNIYYLSLKCETLQDPLIALPRRPHESGRQGLKVRTGVRTFPFRGQ